MCDDLKIGLLKMIDEESTEPNATWDAPLSWAAVVDALADLMVSLRGRLSSAQIETLATVAVMAQRQAMEPAASSPETGDAA